MHLLRYAVQRSLSHTNPSLTRTTLLADFDSMWRGSALFSIAAGHRLDVLRGEVEERIAERQQQQRAALQPRHSESSAGISDLRKQLRKPVAAPSGKPLSCICEDISADSDRSQAPQPRVSRLVARLSGAGRLTAFWALRQPRRPRCSANYVVRVSCAGNAERNQPNDFHANRSGYANYIVRATTLTARTSRLPATLLTLRFE